MRGRRTTASEAMREILDASNGTAKSSEIRARLKAAGIRPSNSAIYSAITRWRAAHRTDSPLIEKKQNVRMTNGDSPTDYTDVTPQPFASDNLIPIVRSIAQMPNLPDEDDEAGMSALQGLAEAVMAAGSVQNFMRAAQIVQIARSK